tara:strand:+ start:947 stop:1174 length:228 start_codon:yes stop_codon:yes gene_type:complete
LLSYDPNASYCACEPCQNANVELSLVFNDTDPVALFNSVAILELTELNDPDILAAVSDLIKVLFAPKEPDIEAAN